MTDISRSILVVDDEINILKTMRRIFRSNGYEVFTANSGAEAIEILNNEPRIEVVLSDFRMPNMNGGQLLEYIQANFDDKTCLIISGFTDFNSALSVLNNGSAYKFLTKPWDNTNLLEEIDEAFEYRRSQLDQKNIIGLSKHLLSRNDFQTHIKQLENSDQACIIYFDIKNSLDLQRDGVAIDEIIDKLILLSDSTIQHKKACYRPSHQDIVLIVELDKDQSINSDIKTLYNEVISTFEGKYDGRSIDVGSSFLYLNAQFSTTNYLYETLQEASILVRSQTDFVAITEQYISAKKRQLTIKSDVQKALEANQFSLAFQPKITLSSGLVEGAEVLLRWRHEELGWISPSEFIEIAEADGQIVAIGDWVIKHGIAALSRFARLSHEIKRMSINVSAAQLMNLKIVQTIKETLENNQVPPEMLVVEVTETSLIQNLAVTSKTLEALKSLGVSIAIDDFGVGYSSFAYLSKLPIDILKLDKALLDDIEYNTDTQVLIENLIATCHTLDIEVVAEGVENEPTLIKLTGANCDYVQGFYYSPPVKAQDIEKVFVAQPYRQKSKPSVTH